MLTDVRRSRYVREVLGDPVHVILFTVAISIAVTATSQFGPFAQIVGIAAITVTYVLIGCFVGSIRYKDELFRSLPGQIRYYGVTKHIEIKASGSADVTYEYTGLNIGDSPLRSIYHIFEYDGEPAHKLPLKAFVGNSEHLVHVKSHVKMSDGKVIGHYSSIYFEFEEAIKKGHQFPRHGFTAEGIDFRQAFISQDYTSQKIEIITDSLRISVSVPPDYHLANVSEQVLDFHRREDPAELARIRRDCLPAVSHNQTRAVWDISAPRLTYSYRLNFAVQR